MTVIFDLDGTLVDSAPEIVGAMEHAWYAVIAGTPFPRERFRIGPPLAQTVSALSPELDEAQGDAIAAAFRARYDASDFSDTLPFAGILDAIDTLATRGVNMSVATNKRRAPTLAILARWFPGRFRRIACVDGVSPDDGTRPGAKAAMLTWIARTTGYTPGSAVMVGDTTSDIAAARAVGMRSVAVTWGYEEASTLVTALPDELVHDVPSLLAALESTTG